MSEIIIVPVVILGFYSAFKLLSEHLLKRKLIGKDQTDKIPVLFEHSTTDFEGEPAKYPTLKWGLVVLFLGIGLILSVVLDQWIVEGDYSRHVTEILRSGIIIVCTSLGFLSYFAIIARKFK